MRRNLRLLLSLVVLGATSPLPASGQDSTRGTRWTDTITYPDLVNAPNSVRGTIAADRRARESDPAAPGLGDTLDGWFEWKHRLQDERGLALGLDYGAVGLGATESLGERQAFGGAVRFFGSWDLTGRKTQSTGSFIWKIEHRHAYSSVAPSEFAATIGYAGGIEEPFTDEGFHVTNLYWRQALGRPGALLAGGFLDITDYVDVYTLASAWSGFMNSAFDTGTATIASGDDASLGLVGHTMLGDNVYLVAGFINAHSDPRNPFNEVGSFFDDNEYFATVEVGWVASLEREDSDNVHVTLWHLDDRDGTGDPGGWGVAFSAVRYIDDRWLPFLRGGFSDDAGAVLEGSVSAGLGYDVIPNRQLLGIGFNWGRPNADLFGPDPDDQYTVEVFYRLGLTRVLTITPDVQYIVNPALNPAVDSLWVFGLRARFAF